MSRRIIALGIWIVAVATYLVIFGIPFEREQILLICVSGLVAASVGVKGRSATALRDWVPLAVLLVAYDYTRGAASLLGRPVQVDSIVDLERRLFGVIPSEWFQSWSLSLGAAWLIPTSAVYASFFVVPYGVAAYLWYRDRELWLKWRARFLSVVGLGLATYILLPAAPPWAAARVGVIGPVARSSAQGWMALNFPIASDLIDNGRAVSNDYAAMPSLHMAFTVVTVIAMAPLLTRPGRWAAALYPVAMGISLIATGEHYVIDVIAGTALVVVVHLFWNRREAMASGPPYPEAESRPIARRRAWVTPMAVTVAIAAVIRIVRLITPTSGVAFEALNVDRAAQLAVSGVSIGDNFLPLSHWAVALAIRLFGQEPLVWRAPVFIAGLGVVAGASGASWLATRDRRLAALAGFLCAIDGILVISGRLALGEAAASLAVVLVVVGLLALWSDGGWIATGTHSWAPVVTLVAGGLAVGMRLSLFPVAIVSVCGVALAHRRRFGSSALPVGLAGVVVTVAVFIFGFGTPQRCDQWWCDFPPVAQVAQATTVTSAAIHNGVDAPLRSEEISPGWSWVVQGRPSKLLEIPCADMVAKVDNLCPGNSEGTARIIAIGNPVLWLAGFASLAYLGFKRRDRSVALVTISLAAALWIPWIIPGTSPYSWFGAPLVPVLCTALTLVLHESRWRVGASVALGIVSATWFTISYTWLIGIV